jgi:hypothetical protein
VFLTTASQSDLTRLIQWIVDFKSKKKPGATDPCKHCVSTNSAKAAKEEHKKRKREEKEAQVKHAFLMNMSEAGGDTAHHIRFGKQEMWNSELVNFQHDVLWLFLAQHWTTGGSLSRELKESADVGGSSVSSNSHRACLPYLCSGG